MNNLRNYCFQVKSSAWV